MTKWEQSQGKIVVKLIDKGYINETIYHIYIKNVKRNLTEKLRKEVVRTYSWTPKGVK